MSNMSIPLLLLLCVLCVPYVVGKNAVNMTLDKALNVTCVRCLCLGATSCVKYECSKDELCGYYHFSYSFWNLGGRIKAEESTQDSEWKDCAFDYDCATATVKGFMKQHPVDCDGNGIIDCDDFASIHYNGPNACDIVTDLNKRRSYEKSNFFRRYKECKIDYLIRKKT